MRSEWVRRQAEELSWRGGLVIAGLLLLWITGAAEAGADDQFYSYVDDKGTTVMTNKWESIPERYRARAKVMGKPGEPLAEGAVKGNEGSGPSQMAARAGTMATQAAEGLKEMIPTPEVKIPGLSEHQSRVLILGFAAAVLMGAIMMLTGNPAVRLLMRWLLVLLAIGTTASMYFSDGGGLMPKAKGAAKELEKTQQGKAAQVQELEAGPKAP